MSVKSYKKGSDFKLSNNFRVREFDCNGKGCCSQTLIDTQLVEYLQKIREHFGKRVNVSSGYRCEKHNANVANAAAKSRHILGMAADIKVEGVAPAEVARYAESIGVLGIGLYDTDKDGHFVHIDTRTSKSFWFGHVQQRRTTFGGAPEEACSVEVEVLKKGAKGAQVKAMQFLLIGNGFSCGETGADGSFGPDTEKALLSFQKDRGLCSGICDKATWAALLGAMA